MLVRAVGEGLVDVGPDGPRLCGGRCAACNHVHFPAADACPWCGAAGPAPTSLGARGRLWLWTVVTARPPGYHGPLPYGFGVVELDGMGLRVVTRLTETDPDRLRLGQPMRLVLDVFGADDGVSVQAWAFAPLEEP